MRAYPDLDKEHVITLPFIMDSNNFVDGYQINIFLYNGEQAI